MMQKLQPALDLDGFFARVHAASSRVLMLDYDGTLAPFHVDPAQARPYPGIPALLDAIIQTGGTRLVIVSGRWIKSLVPLLGIKSVPEIWGSYGWERLLPDGEYSTAPVQASAFEALATAEQWVADIERLGARCERKPTALAFHWRGLAKERVVEIHDRILEKWTRLAVERELGWHDFDGGIEFRALGWDKGEAVRAIVAGSDPQAVCAYLGDDLEDERAFKAIPDSGLSVLVREQFRPTAADLWIQPPQEVREFLVRWRQAGMR
jgi:trehalose 6-phosphate phosphatase